MVSSLVVSALFSLGILSPVVPHIRIRCPLLLSKRWCRPLLKTLPRPMMPHPLVLPWRPSLSALYFLSAYLWPWRLSMPGLSCPRGVSLSSPGSLPLVPGLVSSTVVVFYSVVVPCLSGSVIVLFCSTMASVVVSWSPVFPWSTLVVHYSMSNVLRSFRASPLAGGCVMFFSLSPFFVTLDF